ncbi:MAG: hypothetical protein U9P44_02780 [archaeon]|nr:hypothetical protein [archaeon]
MLEYFVFVLMIIIGAAIIVFSLDKKRWKRGSYVDISRRGNVASGKRTYYKKTPARSLSVYSEEKNITDNKFDTLFSGKSEKKNIDNKERYRRILERRKNLRPGEIEIPMQGKRKREGIPIKKTYKPAEKQFDPITPASASKLSKLKRRVMDIYDDLYEKEEKPAEEEKPSIFSMFGQNEETRREQSPPQPLPPQQSQFGEEIKREETDRYSQTEFARSSPAPIPLPGANPGGSTLNINDEINKSGEGDNNFGQTDKKDEVTKDDMFKMMLGVNPKKEELPKKKENNEWTPMF